MSEGHRFPAVKRIGWLKTSDFEGYKHSDEGLRRMRKKKLRGAREPDLDFLIMLSSTASNMAVERQLAGVLSNTLSAVQTFAHRFVQRPME